MSFLINFKYQNHQDALPNLAEIDTNKKAF